MPEMQFKLVLLLLLPFPSLCLLSNNSLFESVNHDKSSGKQQFI